MERWSGRVALVTGASAGIGEAVTRKLVQHGMNVVGCSRNIENIQKLSNDLKLSGAKGCLTAIKCDIGKEDEILSMFQQIKTDLGGVDVCVNSAGFCHMAPLLSGKTELWKSMLDVDVLGLCVCTREAVKSMQERNVDDGHIVHVNSLSGYRIMKDPTYHFHAATKFAVTALTEGLRNELRAMKSHIRVSAVSPGLVQTEFHQRMFDSKEKAEQIYDSLVCLKPDDIADAIVYAIGAPPHVQVHDILIRPVEQVT